MLDSCRIHVLVGILVLSLDLLAAQDNDASLLAESLGEDRGTSRPAYKLQDANGLKSKEVNCARRHGIAECRMIGPDCLETPTVDAGGMQAVRVEFPMLMHKVRNSLGWRRWGIARPIHDVTFTMLRWQYLFPFQIDCQLINEPVVHCLLPLADNISMFGALQAGTTRGDNNPRWCYGAR